MLHDEAGDRHVEGLSAAVLVGLVAGYILALVLGMVSFAPVAKAGIVAVPDVFPHGLGTAVASVFGGLPNTSFSQNVGIVGMTGIMSRHVVTIGAIILVVCGFLPKIGAVIASMPLPVLGGGVIVMFGMVAAAGLNLVPTAVQYLPDVLHTMAVSGLLPTVIIAIMLNQVLPKDI